MGAVGKEDVVDECDGEYNNESITSKDWIVEIEFKDENVLNDFERTDGDDLLDG